MKRTFSLINHLVAVVDDPAQVDDVVSRLTALGIPSENITVLRGEEGARLVDSSGSSSWLARLQRVGAYISADQSSDYVMYDAALRDGRVVIAVRFRDRRLKEAATDALREAGAHFLNFYGRFQTEEITRWQGPELILPPLLPPPRTK